MATTTTTLLSLAVLAGGATGAWDPNGGDWSKSDETDLRIMTWNVQDALCRTQPKTDTFTSWNGIVRTVAALQPDVLILQECGDNNGNGTGGGIDSVSQLETVMDLFVNGGNDPFLGGQVGSYLKLFDPTLDYPHVFVSSTDDNFNRNVIISRYPFADLNNDTQGTALRSDIVVLPDEYAPGINGGLRGYMWAEIDLPDAVYAGDVVVGNGHLKCCGGNGSSEWDQRIEACQNVAYWIDYFYNGAGTGEPDPNNRIPFDWPDGDPNGPTLILDENTPVVWGGDMNDTPGDGPAEWMTNAQFAGGPGGDGTDRDGSDSARDFASHPLTGDTTTQSSNKLDYLFWQDSIATSRREFIFRTDSGWPGGVAFPFPVDGMPPVPQVTTSIASDHRPVLVDLIVPLADDPPVECPGDANGDNSVDLNDLNAVLAWWDTAVDPGTLGDVTGDGLVNLDDLNLVLTNFDTTC